MSSTVQTTPFLPSLYDFFAPGGVLSRSSLPYEFRRGQLEMAQAVERALEGSDLALKLCLDRILAPRRERTVNFALPPIESPADLSAALGAVAAAVAEGALTPGEAATCRRSPPPIPTTPRAQPRS